jgi:hypothetical protein
LTIREPLAPDEARWFLAAVEHAVVRFRTCDERCDRMRRWNASGPDHFDSPDRGARHLFSNPTKTEAWLNREYVPHIAAYARLILDCGFDHTARSFSRYRSFQRDGLTEGAGQSYETDAEFYEPGGAVYLQVEAKASPTQTAQLAGSIEKHGILRELPAKIAKEIEYVLDLSPRYLWVVGPGSIDPARYVYAVHVSGTDARFEPIADVPLPP